MYNQDSQGCKGFTLIELLMALVLSAILLSALGGVVSTGLTARANVSETNRLTREARFAMQRMVQAVESTGRLLLPSADRAATSWPENIREETVPASAPPTGSTKATAVLAVTLPRYSNLDGDAFADADNDADGRIDEDLPADIHNDGKSGISGIDDEGGGGVDDGFSSANDDEFFFFSDEDPVNGADDDGDGSVDEDPPADMNNDSCPGFCGVDDDGDGNIDEGNAADDDEDGSVDEDWFDPVVFYLEADVLKERTPVPWDENNDATVDGEDFVISDIASNVTRLRVERLVPGTDRTIRVELILELTDPTSGQTVSLTTHVRVGSAN